MMPLKNGVTIYLPEYNTSHKADVYQINSVYIFVANRLSLADPSPHATVWIKNGMDRESQGYRLIIVPSDNVNKIRAWEEK